MSFSGQGFAAPNKSAKGAPPPTAQAERDPAEAPGETPVPINDVEAPPTQTEKGTALSPVPSPDDEPKVPTVLVEPDNSRGTAPTDRRTTIEDEYKPSSSSGEPLFDWSKHKGETEVAHPLAPKGLIRIDKDKTYFYRVEETHQKSAMSLQIGVLNPTNLKNPNLDGPYNTFGANYNNTNANPAIILSKEWQFFPSAIGKFGVRFGSGLFVAQGNGHFTGDDAGRFTPKETFTFFAAPTSLSGIYRMQLKHRQLLVPYGEAGATAFVMVETRDDNKAPKFGGAPAIFGAGGFAFNTTYFNYMTRIQLDREYGIRAIYLTLEYRKIVGLSHYDMSSDYFNGGFLVEY